MDSTARTANLKQYRSVGGKWTFVPVVKVNGKPDPRLVLIDGEPSSSKGGGKFYIEYRDGGKRIQKPCGVTTREALDAWHLQSGILSGAVEQSAEEAPGEGKSTLKTIDHAITEYLTSVKATKGLATWSKYRKTMRDRLLRSQSSDGSWTSGYIGPHYSTCINLTILQLDNGTLPIYNR